MRCDGTRSDGAIMNRRQFIRTFIASSVLLVAGASGLVEIERLANGAASQQQLPVLTQNSVGAASGGSSQTSALQTGTQAAAQDSGSSVQPAAIPGYVAVTTLSSLGSKTAAYFSHPNYGESLLINLGGEWKAFSATCTHRPCSVSYQGSTIYCPCHGATFSPNNGSVTRGPAPTSLPEFGVQTQGDTVYVSLSRTN